MCLSLVQKYEKNAVANDKCVFATCTEFIIVYCISRVENQRFHTSLQN
jgi:hypothetical protein